MKNPIGIRREYKNSWEKRTPLTLEAVKELTEKGERVMIESSDNRIFSDKEYSDSGAEVVASLGNCPLVVGIKEPRIEDIKQDQIHLAFSHTIKGQDYNMGLLKHCLDSNVTLVDYELFTNDENIRTLAFGRYAGIAGAVDTLSILGEKLKLKGENSPLKQLKQTYNYQTTDKIKQICEELSSENLDLKICITGAGNVSKGAEEVCNYLGLRKLDADEVLAGLDEDETNYYFVLDIEDFISFRADHGFDFDEYLEFGKQKFESIFSLYLGSFNVLLHGAYWDSKFPRLLTIENLKNLNSEYEPLVIGDISCDINGSIECTDRATTIDEPAFTYYPKKMKYMNGIEKDGITIMSIDNLPCELSIDASNHFSAILKDLIGHLSAFDPKTPYEEIELPAVLKKAIITHQGKLTPGFIYLKEFI